MFLVYILSAKTITLYHTIFELGTDEIKNNAAYDIILNMSKKEFMMGLADDNNAKFLELRRQVEQVQQAALKGSISGDDLVDLSNNLTIAYENYLAASTRLWQAFSSI